MLSVQEWSLWNTMGDTVLHIELRRWADLVVLAPASANTMAKMTAGGRLLLPAVLFGMIQSSCASITALSIDHTVHVLSLLLFVLPWCHMTQASVTLCCSLSSEPWIAVPSTPEYSVPP